MRARVPVWYSDAYAVADAPVLARLAVSADAFDATDALQWHAPPVLDRSLLAGLHDPEYLDAFHVGREPLASSQGVRWSPAVRDATYAMLSGQLAAARHALHFGASMNLARGFHHAVRQRGAGFCAINGLALIAHAHPELRVFVVDCDEHGGNGTEEFAAELPNLYCASIFGTRFGCRGGLRSWAWEIAHAPDRFDRYLDALQDVDALLEDLRPDLVLYQAGADCHELDPKSRLKLSTGQLAERDARVLQMAAARSIPVCVCVGGGYQRPNRVAALNLNTLFALRRMLDSVITPV